MPKNTFAAGHAPDPAWGAYSAPPDPLAGNGEGPPGRGRERERTGRKGRGEGRGGEGNGGKGRGRAAPERKSWLRPC